MWYSEAPEWAGCAITQVLSQNGRHKQLDLLSLSCMASSPLTKLEQESLIKIATSGSVEIWFNQKSLPDFWIGLRSEFFALANRAVKTLMPVATTYLSESGFSALTSMKTKYWHRLCVENDLRAFSYRARFLWNGLPTQVRDADSVSTFKSLLKTHLFSGSYDWV